VAEPQEFGEVPGGRRRIIEILGGTFEGPNIRGRVLPGGADWQLVRPDGFAELIQWLTRHIFVATADRHPEDVVVRVWMLE